MADSNYYTAGEEAIRNTFIMAGKDSASKKSLLKQVTEVLQKSCNKMQKFESSKNNNSTATKLIDTADSSYDYATWPSAKLRTTIEDMVHVFLKDHTKSTFSIIDEIEHELNSEYPTDIEEQLDFCMMCSQVDHMEAVELQKHFCSEYDLAGKVLWECFTLGRDLFSVIEDMLNNSTKLLFYITERFDDDDPCAHVARNLLLEQDHQGTKRKIIPLVSEFDTSIPETFQLIDKLYLSSKLQFQFRFQAVFTEEVKYEKIVRAENLRRKLDNERKVILESLVRKKLRL